MRDALPDKTKDLESGIMNLDVSSGPGTHWTCWFKYPAQRSSKSVCCYFDSFGLPPPVEFNTYMNCDIYHSTYQIQKLGDVICGHLCIIVLYMMTVCNMPFHQILLHIKKDER